MEDLISKIFEKLKRLKAMLPTIFSIDNTGGTPTSPSSLSQRGRFSGVSIDDSIIHIDNEIIKSILLKRSRVKEKEDFTTNINAIINRVNSNKDGFFSKDSEIIVELSIDIAKVIGDDQVNLSEFVVAKVKGIINNFSAHTKITDEILRRIPHTLCNPYKILHDDRVKGRNKFLFIGRDPLHQIVVEVQRAESGKTEINTIFDMRNSELKRLEDKLPTVFSSGETPSSRIHASR